ncbi:hypothetical protein AMTRI_Chr01g136090 [Amborella trichopoda]
MEENRDLLKTLDWKALGNVSDGQPIKKRLPRKVRQAPDYYFLPRRSIPTTIALYGAIGAAGIGAGMLVELWINKKVQEDGGIIWEMDKN